MDKFCQLALRGMFFRLAAVAFVLTHFGCSRQEVPVPPSDMPTDPGFHVGVEKALLRDLKPSDAVVWVNREPITKGDYQRRVSLAERLYRLNEKLPLEGDDRTIGKKFKRNNAYYFTELISACLVRQEARRCGIVAGDDDLKTMRRVLSKSIQNGKYKFEQILKRLPPRDGEALVEWIEAQALGATVARVTATNSPERVTEEDVDSALRQISEFNQRAARENEKSRKRALKAKAEILGGASFAEVSKRVAQVHPEYGERWEDLQLGEFEPGEPIRQWLEKAVPGDISDPIDLDDGLAIIGLVAKTELGVPGGKSTDPVVYSYRAVRCTFRAFEVAPERTREELLNEILADRRKAAASDLLARLRGKAVIYLPYGDELFPQRAPKPAKPLPPALQDLISEEQNEPKAPKGEVK